MQDIDEGLRALHGKIAISAASGDQTLLAAVSDAKIRVLGLWLLTDVASALTFKSGSTTISGVPAFAANGGIVLPPTKWGYFSTEKNEALVLNVGTAATVGGTFTYALIQ